jgi:hypothetical protein
MRARNALGLSLVVVVVGTAFCGSAHAAERFDSPALKAVITSDTTVVTSETRQVRARVQITAGPRLIGFELRGLSPNFLRLESRQRASEGPTINLLRMLRTDGSNRVYYGGYGEHGTGGCRFADVGVRPPRGGATARESSRGVVLKPRESVTYELVYDVSPDNPWFGSSYAPSIQLRPIARHFGPDKIPLPRGLKSLSRSVTLQPATITRAGPFAARIDVLKIAKPTSGQPAAILGALVPARAGRTVVLSAARLRDSFNFFAQLSPVVTAVTDSEGHFSFSSWVPLRKVLYATTISYPEQPGDLLPDSTCPAPFYLDK